LVAIVPTTFVRISPYNEGLFYVIKIPASSNGQTLDLSRFGVTQNSSILLTEEFDVNGVLLTSSKITYVGTLMTVNNASTVLIRLTASAI
jgi:hypothetical protein